MEITKTCDVKELNNNTRRPMTLRDFERKYLDPRIRQGFDELNEMVTQHGINIERVMREVDKLIEENNKLIDELSSENSDE